MFVVDNICVITRRFELKAIRYISLQISPMEKAIGHHRYWRLHILPVDKAFGAFDQLDGSETLASQ
jgi:hypothetical protein